MLIGNFIRLSGDKGLKLHPSPYVTKPDNQHIYPCEETDRQQRRSRQDRSDISRQLFSEFRQFEIPKSIPEVISKILMRFVTPNPRVDAGSNVFAVRSI
jgi:hypothetical protein